MSVQPWTRNNETFQEWINGHKKTWFAAWNLQEIPLTEKQFAAIVNVIIENGRFTTLSFYACELGSWAVLPMVKLLQNLPPNFTKLNIGDNFNLQLQSILAAVPPCYLIVDINSLDDAVSIASCMRDTLTGVSIQMNQHLHNWHASVCVLGAAIELSTSLRYFAVNGSLSFIHYDWIPHFIQNTSLLNVGVWQEDSKWNQLRKRNKRRLKSAELL